MPSRLNPYVNFDGNTREAMEYYKDVFGGELNINTFGEYGNADPAIADKTMHAQLETESGFTLMASDGPPGTELTVGDNISISPQRRRRRRAPRILGQALRRRHGHDAPREADVGRRVRHVRRPVRHALDGRHRRRGGVIDGS